MGVLYILGILYLFPPHNMYLSQNFVAFSFGQALPIKDPHEDAFISCRVIANTKKEKDRQTKIA